MKHQTNSGDKHFKNMHFMNLKNFFLNVYHRCSFNISNQATMAEDQNNSTAKK